LFELNLLSHLLELKVGYYWKGKFDPLFLPLSVSLKITLLVASCRSIVLFDLLLGANILNQFLFQIGYCSCSSPNRGRRREGGRERGHAPHGDVEGLARPRPGGVEGPTPKHDRQDLRRHSRNGTERQDSQDSRHQRKVQSVKTIKFEHSRANCWLRVKKIFRLRGRVKNYF
jgi:hypothetical protein